MRSSNLNLKRSASRYKVDGRWSSPDGDVLVEVMQTHNVRDILGGLFALAYLLQDDEPSTHALCVLVQSKLSPDRIAYEVARFRGLLLPDIARRIHLTSLDDVEQLGADLPCANDTGFIVWLQELSATQGVVSLRASRQTVVSAVALSWLRGAGPMTSKALQALCGASYPTAVAAIAEFMTQDVLEPRTDRQVLLRYLSVEQWLRIAQQHAASRKVYRYTDPTGLARSSEAMASRLFKLQQFHRLPQNIAVGGVLGARHYFPDLDITASPRLDLSVYAASGVDFVRHIDAGLVLTTDVRTRPAVVVHVTTEPQSFINQQDGVWASEMECCADLLDMGLLREADDMMRGLMARRLDQPRNTTL